MSARRTALAGLWTAVIVLLAACSTYTQTTSGKDYLNRYAEQARLAGVETGPGKTRAADPTGIAHPDIRAAADVEPLLTFPARLGIARLENARMSPIPQAEADAWMDLAGRLGADWGEFVPISPLIAALARQSAGGESMCHERYPECLDKTVRDIRLGAARQHVDAVLIYEPFAWTEVTSNPLAVAKLVLIGFFLPSEDVASDGYAQAVLVDVRNGYTYGLASARSDRAAFALATSANEDAVADRLGRRAATAAAINLTGEVETMLRDLRLELAEKRAKRAEAAAKAQ